MDRVTKFLAHDGRVNVICANTTKLIDQIREIHDLTPTTTAALGRFATISGMMGLTEIKEDEEKFTIQMKGNGPIGEMISVVTRKGNTSKVKVCIDNPFVNLPLNENNKIDVGGAVGKKGYLNVLRQDLLTRREYNGLIPLVSGEIAEDFTSYFAKSKQTPTVIALGVLVNQFGVKSAGGYMIQLMPDATEEDIVNIEKAIEKAPSITTMLSEKKSLEDIARIITGDENILILAQEPKIECECDCSKEKFERGLMTLDSKELEDIIEEDGKADIECHFCHEKYYFSKEELEKILDEVKNMEKPEESSEENS